jgi:hypothetical protein
MGGGLQYGRLGDCFTRGMFDHTLPTRHLNLLAFDHFEYCYVQIGRKMLMLMNDRIFMKNWHYFPLKHPEKIRKAL